ncbi:hypothetical protein CK203_048224 [Vitis vinifera]|uniref:Uncharacterized protein n=1 Tax=Vitis vinifera TaxID=29760 RepID=A0A438H469_VITVI|nr:hypothetical protein CK203_048224 [Vitis vinifera]
MCAGGFVAMDGPTERMEDLRWARPLFRKKAEDRRSAEGCEEGTTEIHARRRSGEWSSAGIEAQFRSGDVMDGLPDGRQWAVFEWASGEGGSARIPKGKGDGDCDCSEGQCFREWADSALHKEVMTYEALSSLEVYGFREFFFFFYDYFWSDPEGEFFDHSGKARRSVKLTEILKGKRLRYQAEMQCLLGVG